MKDKNGIEMRTGDVVCIENAYFKNDNGYWYIEHSPGDPTWCGTDYSLRKISKKGRISTARHNIAFYPLKAFTSNRWKNAEARKHNDAHATIEVMNGIDRSEIAEHFLNESHRESEWADSFAWHWGDEPHPEVLKRREIAEFYKLRAEELCTE